jgi:hypothetical protein
MCRRPREKGILAVSAAYHADPAHHRSRNLDGHIFPEPAGIENRPSRLVRPGIVELRLEGRLSQQKVDARGALPVVDMFDDYDGDPDFENGGDDEPSLGLRNPMGENGVIFNPDELPDVGPADDDREDEPEHAEDDGTAEPYLGWPNPTGERLDAASNRAPGGNWVGSNDDRELHEAEGRQEDAGDEPEDITRLQTLMPRLMQQMEPGRHEPQSVFQVFFAAVPNSWNAAAASKAVLRRRSGLWPSRAMVERPVITVTV